MEGWPRKSSARSAPQSQLARKTELVRLDKPVEAKRFVSHRQSRGNSSRKRGSNRIRRKRNRTSIFRFLSRKGSPADGVCKKAFHLAPGKNGRSLSHATVKQYLTVRVGRKSLPPTDSQTPDFGTSPPSESLRSGNGNQPTADNSRNPEPRTQTVKFFPSGGLPKTESRIEFCRAARRRRASPRQIPFHGKNRKIPETRGARKAPAAPFRKHLPSVRGLSRPAQGRRSQTVRRDGRSPGPRLRFSRRQKRCPAERHRQGPENPRVGVAPLEKGGRGEKSPESKGRRELREKRKTGFPRPPTAGKSGGRFPARGEDSRAAGGARGGEGPGETARGRRGLRRLLRKPASRRGRRRVFTGKAARTFSTSAT